MTRRAIFVPLLLMMLACGGALGSAKADFKAGRVADAKDKLVALEPESRAWNGTRRGEYALYRGLVHRSLGDRDAASRWLGEAKAIEDAAPHTLSDDDRARLELALDSLR